MPEHLKKYRFECIQEEYDEYEEVYLLAENKEEAIEIFTNMIQEKKNPHYELSNWEIIEKPLIKGAIGCNFHNA